MNTNGISLGKIYGIDIRINYSWFILFAIIALSLTFQVLPLTFPDMAMPVQVITGLTMTALFFISVLVHELSHAIYAKKQGIKIERITLFIFGGAAEIQDEPRFPRQEFIMAALGPFTSIAIGVIFILMGNFGLLMGLVPLVAMGSILAVINFALAIFNLAPGFPLDGGRMLRALLWKSTGNYLKASRIAAFLGQGFGYLLMGYGLISILAGGQLGGIWLILIGFFLSQSAALSYQQTVARSLLKDLRVADLMEKDSLAYKELTGSTHEAVYPNLVQLETRDTNNLQKKAENIPKNEDRPVLHPNDAGIEAFSKLLHSGQENAPVIDNSRVVGVISLRRINEYLSGKSKLKA